MYGLKEDLKKANWAPSWKYWGWYLNGSVLVSKSWRTVGFDTFEVGIIDVGATDSKSLVYTCGIPLLLSAVDRREYIPCVRAAYLLYHFSQIIPLR
jgi:hypothetical protein